MYRILHVIHGEYLYEDTTFDIVAIGYLDGGKIIEGRFKFLISRKLRSLMDNYTNKLYVYPPLRSDNDYYGYLGISREEFEIVKV